MRSTATVIVGMLVGVVIGLGVYTFVYARGYSYLSNDPAACSNCHVMRDYYDGWMKSSHRVAAKCNDCHTPHNLPGKYAIKATNGFLHSFAFTTGRFPDNILIKGYNQRVTQETCVNCHADVASAMLGVHSRKDASCLECHFNVGHSAASFTWNLPAGTPAADQSEDSSYGNR